MVLFEDQVGYEIFLRSLIHAHGRVPIELFSYCLMPNHFHLVVRPDSDVQLSQFMRRLTSTHGKRWHTLRGSVGGGAVYQGRFRAVPVQGDRHFLTVCRYVERNALRAKLVTRAEAWPWSSAHQRCNLSHVIELSTWPILQPGNWTDILNGSEPVAEAAAIRKALVQGLPLGDPAWRNATIQRLGLEGKERGRGRPAGKKTPGVFSGDIDPKNTRCFFNARRSLPHPAVRLPAAAPPGADRPGQS